MKAAILIALAGCVDVANDGTDWQDISTITGVLAPEQGPDPAPRPAPCQLRIATWNVHFANDVADLATQIEASQELVAADVLIVQEIRHFTSEPTSRAQALAEALGMTWVYAPAHPVVDEIYGDGVHGVAILSHFPLATPQVRQLPYFDQPNPEQRIALRADIMLDGDPLHLVDVHLDTRLAPTDRIRQLDPAIHDVGDRMIIGGDLNTLPWVWVDGAIPLIDTTVVDDQQQAKTVDDFFAYNSFTRAIPFDVNTSRYPPFTIRLDDLYSRGLPVVAGDVEYVDGSDHWPVWFDLDRCP